MNFRVYYTDFHWDNYQGGSGKTVEGAITVSVPGDCLVKNLSHEILGELEAHTLKSRPFNQDNAVFVRKIKLV